MHTGHGILSVTGINPIRMGVMYPVQLEDLHNLGSSVKKKNCFTILTVIIKISFLNIGTHILHHLELFPCTKNRAHN